MTKDCAPSATCSSVQAEPVKRVPVSRVPPPPRYLGGISPPQAPIVTIPKIAIEYPGDFSQAARSRIFREQVRAGDALDQKRSSIRSTEDLKAAQLSLILQVFAAFAKEACDLGRQGTWAAERCGSECLTVLLHCARVVRLTREGTIPDDVQSTIERSDKWKEYRQLILEVADKQAADAQVDSIRQAPKVKPSEKADSDETEAVAERAARRRAVVNPILRKKHWKPGRLVTAAGVGKNSVYQYLDGTRAKITEENREAIAQALDLRPEQLPD